MFDRGEVRGNRSVEASLRLIMRCMSERPGFLTRLGMAYYGAKRGAALDEFKRWFEFEHESTERRPGSRITMCWAEACIAVCDRTPRGAHIRRKVAALPPDHQALWAAERLTWIQRRCKFPEDLWLRFWAAENDSERIAINREYEMSVWGNVRNPWDEIDKKRP